MAKCPCLIIGNSTATLGCIEGIRSADTERRIPLVATEQDPIYARPLISYWLAGKIGDAEMSFVPPDFYDVNGVEAILGAEVVRVDSQAREAVLADGRTLGFEKLLIASGGTPILPAEPDVTGVARVSTFTCWDDARRAKAWIAEGGVRSAVVVGGGFIGIETVEALLALGVQPTIVELADRIMGAAFDATSSAMAVASLERAGVGVCCGTAVQAVSQRDGRLTGVTLRGGRALACELLLFAIGVRPNIQFLEGSGLELGRGVCVDEHLETSAPGIYAAGDIAEALDRLSGESRPIPILRNARRQGQIAGANMAGAHDDFRGGVAMNSTDVCGLPCISVGLANPPEEGGCDILVARNERAATYKKIVLKGSRIVGAICIGAIGRAGVLRHLIEEKVDIAGLRGRLLDDDFPLELLPAAYWQRGRAVAP